MKIVSMKLNVTFSKGSSISSVIGNKKGVKPIVLTNLTTLTLTEIYFTTLSNWVTLCITMRIQFQYSCVIIIGSVHCAKSETVWNE